MTTILVVDDEPAIAELLGQLLEEEGYQVISASNGEEALAVISSRRPDLILSDVMMPLLDGIGLCRELRANPDYAEIPFLFMSALPLSAEARRCGPDGFIQKPFDLLELLNALDRVLLELS